MRVDGGFLAGVIRQLRLLSRKLCRSCQLAGFVGSFIPSGKGRDEEEKQDGARTCGGFLESGPAGARCYPAGFAVHITLCLGGFAAASVASTRLLVVDASLIRHAEGFAPGNPLNIRR
jgi:hypothetical protein